MSQLILIKTLRELEALEEEFKDKDFIAYDCETVGLDRDDEVIGFSVCASTEKAYYVIISMWSVEQQKLIYLETKEGAKRFIESLVDKKLIMHNGVFDCWKAEVGFGVNLISSLHTDTMILAHLLNENRLVGLKDLAVSIYGEDSKQEQTEMKESVHKNGGLLTKEKYELYKADCDLIGKYGAKDALLTLKLFYHLVPELFEQKLDKFFYEEESMPLLRGPTYQMNTVGLRIDSTALQKLKGELEAECMEAKAFIHNEITPYIKDEYPGTGKSNTFNIGASKQLSWLLFFRLGNEFNNLTKGGRELCKALNTPIPYSHGAKREFLKMLRESKGAVYEEAKYNPKTKKMGRPKKIGNAWNYLACGKDSLKKYESKYKWCKKLLEYAKNLKLLNTYVEGIQSRAKYNIIRPSFLQHGTTSGRYSSRNPNFQNLPRNDKRIKSCIIARPGNVFVGADYSQLEPRVFASFSKDKRLTECFKTGDDFYSVIGVHTFNKQGLSLKKDDADSFAKKHPDLRDKAKVVGLSATYGNTAFQMARVLDCSIDKAQAIIDDYFTNFPSVMKYMFECHKKVIETGQVENLFGRPRRIPEAMTIRETYGKTEHANLPYVARNMLNLSVNHPIQSTGASIMNRAAIACYNKCRELEKNDISWAEVKIVMQVHDELELEGPEQLAYEMSQVLRIAMETSVKLPFVELVAEPKIGKTLAELK